MSEATVIVVLTVLMCSSFYFMSTRNRKGMGITAICMMFIIVFAVWLSVRG